MRPGKNSSGDKNIVGTVLFVDDEAAIIKTLSRTFRKAPFKIVTGDSAHAGIEILKETPVDMVVSDYKMPRMDGIKFLKYVKTNYPRIRRVILSGYIEESTALQAVYEGTATAYYYKPWDAQKIREDIIHTLQIQQQLHDEKLLGMIDKIENLPTPPALYRNFISAVNRGESIKKMARLFQQDISVATKIIHVVNSAYYGTTKTSSVENALVRIGLSGVRGLLLTMTVFNQESETEEKYHKLRQVYIRSFLANYAFQRIHQIVLEKLPDDQDISMGLVYNLGRVILARHFSDRYAEIKQVQQNHPGLSFFESEKKLGHEEVSHNKLGAHLLDWWNMPDRMIDLTLYFPEPEKGQKNLRQVLSVINYTDKFLDSIFPENNAPVTEKLPIQLPNMDNDSLEKLTNEILEQYNYARDNFK